MVAAWQIGGIFALERPLAPLPDDSFWHFCDIHAPQFNVPILCPLRTSTHELAEKSVVWVYRG
jgi:hypothetical protein